MALILDSRGHTSPTTRFSFQVAAKHTPLLSVGINSQSSTRRYFAGHSHSFPVINPGFGNYSGILISMNVCIYIRNAVYPKGKCFRGRSAARGLSGNPRLNYDDQSHS